MTEHLRDVWMSPAEELYVVGDNAVILRDAP